MLAKQQSFQPNFHLEHQAATAMSGKETCIVDSENEVLIWKSMVKTLGQECIS